tara:strand:+ start:107 stop:283 length:177 start_codon:yes stop_codon:yes gene_type:complete
MGGMISIAMSYIMWKEYNTIREVRRFKNNRDAWVESHKMLDERALMEKEDKINNIIIL